MKASIVTGLLVGSAYALPPSIYRPQKRQMNDYTFPQQCFWNKTDADTAKLAVAVAGDPATGPGFFAGPLFGPHRGHTQVPMIARFPHFHALGDSYSAGPGAGEYYNEDGGKIGEDWCYRTKGAYAYQLITNNDHRQLFNLGHEDFFQFLSCTGHVTQDVIDTQLPMLDYGVEGSDMKVTLSIGGNDLGFSDALISCLIGVDILDIKCNAAKAFARNLIEDKDGKHTFQESLFKVWMGLRNRRTGFFPTVAHTLYPAFFNDKTANCDETKILKVGPPLKAELRKEFNDLVRSANDAIINHAIEFQSRYDFAMGKLFPIEVDDYYEGHRLCEPIVENLPGFSDDEVWFLGVASSNTEDPDDEDRAPGNWASRAPRLDETDPDTCDPDSKDMGAALGCRLVQYNQTVKHDALAEVRLSIPQWVTKAFHPKAAGFTATVRAITEQLPRNIGSSGAAKRSISAPTKVSISPPAKVEWISPYQRPRRQEMPPMPANNSFHGDIPDGTEMNSVSYPLNIATSGTVACTNQLEKIMGMLGEAHLVDLGDSPNLVLMYDGILEVVESSDADDALEQWKGLLGDLRSEVGDDAVILASALLPPADQSDEVLRRFADFNTMLTEYLDGLSHDERILSMRMDKMVAGPGNDPDSVTVMDISSEDYISMLGHWLNGASHAAINLNWIDSEMTPIDI